LWAQTYEYKKEKEKEKEKEKRNGSRCARRRCGKRTRARIRRGSEAALGAERGVRWDY
jgi:hypothetical protein